MKKILLFLLLLATIAICDYMTSTEQPEPAAAAEPVKPVIINFRNEKHLAE